VSDDHGGLRLLATSSAAPQTIVSTVPLKHCLCVASARVAPLLYHHEALCIDCKQQQALWQQETMLSLPERLCHVLDNASLDCEDHLVLLLCWLHRHGRGSTWWQQWAALLPEPGTVQLAWSADHSTIASLQSDHVRSLCHQERAKHEARWELMQDELDHVLQLPQDVSQTSCAQGAAPCSRAIDV
jgi:hypothetical protein